VPPVSENQPTVPEPIVSSMARNPTAPLCATTLSRAEQSNLR